jgi:hypothetical protein
MTMQYRPVEIDDDRVRTACGFCHYATRGTLWLELEIVDGGGIGHDEAMKVTPLAIMACIFGINLPSSSPHP